MEFMAVIAIALWAIDAASISALSAGIATILGALAALGIAVVSMIKSLRDIKDEQVDVKAKAEVIAVQTSELRQLNTSEHNDNANRIITMQETLIGRLDTQDALLAEVKVDVHSLKREIREARDADETILVLIEDLERKTNNPNFSATVTKIPSGTELEHA